MSGSSWNPLSWWSRSRNQAPAAAPPVVPPEFGLTEQDINNYINNAPVWLEWALDLIVATGQPYSVNLKSSITAADSRLFEEGDITKKASENEINEKLVQKALEFLAMPDSSFKVWKREIEPGVTVDVFTRNIDSIKNETLFFMMKQLALIHYADGIYLMLLEPKIIERLTQYVTNKSDMTNMSKEDKAGYIEILLRTRDEIIARLNPNTKEVTKNSAGALFEMVQLAMVTAEIVKAFRMIEKVEQANTYENAYYTQKNEIVPNANPALVEKLSVLEPLIFDKRDKPASRLA
jgi:hypothetical protein